MIEFLLVLATVVLWWVLLPRAADGSARPQAGFPWVRRGAFAGLPTLLALGFVAAPLTIVLWGSPLAPLAALNALFGTWCAWVWLVSLGRRPD